MNHACRSDAPAPFVGAVAGGVTLLVLTAAFTLHALDVAWAWVVYPLGFGGLLPVALGWAIRAGERRVEPGSPDPQAEALDRLRERYAMGEIDEAEFERRVETVLASTTERRGEVATVGRTETPRRPTPVYRAWTSRRRER